MSLIMYHLTPTGSTIQRMYAFNCCLNLRYSKLHALPRAITKEQQAQCSAMEWFVISQA